MTAPEPDLSHRDVDAVAGTVFMSADKRAEAFAELAALWGSERLFAAMAELVGRTQRLTPPEAARHLKISEAYLAKLRVTGGGPAYHKLGSEVRYTPQDLDMWFAEQRQSSTSGNRKKSA